jgi:hypothetical protein
MTANVWPLHGVDPGYFKAAVLASKGRPIGRSRRCRISGQVAPEFRKLTVLPVNLPQAMIRQGACLAPLSPELGTNLIELEDYGTQPVRLMAVKSSKPPTS